MEILKGFLWGFNIKLIKAINEKVKKKVTKFLLEFLKQKYELRQKS